MLLAVLLLSISYSLVKVNKSVNSQAHRPSGSEGMEVDDGENFFQFSCLKVIARGFKPFFLLHFLQYFKKEQLFCAIPDGYSNNFPCSGLFKNPSQSAKFLPLCCPSNQHAM